LKKKYLGERERIKRERESWLSLKIVCILVPHFYNCSHQSQKNISHI
jgi:hypothetical protein